MAPGTGLVEDNFGRRQFSTDQEGGMVSVSLAHPPLTSAGADWFLTGHRPVPIYSPEVGDP